MIPTTTSDDAKKGEDKPLPSGAVQSKGKELAVFPIKPASSAARAAEPAIKLLASSSTAFHSAALRESLPFGETLEATQSHELQTQGIVELQQVEPLQAIPVVQDKSAKRPAQSAEKSDPAAKRQNVKETLAVKASRTELEKKKKEDSKKRAERAKAKRIARFELLKDQTNTLVNDDILVQQGLMRSAYIPLNPDESEACDLEARIQACRKSLEYIEKLDGYSREEFEFMTKLIHDRKPRFNSELSDRFGKVLPTLQDMPFHEIEERRAHHPDARFIEDFIAGDLKERWIDCRVKFIKAYYFWEVVFNQAECSKFDALHNFMIVYDIELWRKILITAECAERKLINKIPERELFVWPKVRKSIIIDRAVIDREVREAFHLLGIERSSTEQKKEIKQRVLGAYLVE